MDENDKKFDEIEELIEKFLALDDTINLFDNYNHRAERIKLKIQKLWSNFSLTKGRNKSDAKVPNLKLKNVEIKTRNKKETNIERFLEEKFLFDKQDRIGRRNYILKIDGLVFSIFLNELLFWIFWTKEKETLEEYRNIAKEKQKTFIENFERNQKRPGNGGFDTISIGVSDFSENSIWNFYYENNFYENKSLKEIKKILNLI